MDIPMMKIATWNVNSLRVRLAQVLNWLATTAVDILAIQETKLEDKNFPSTAFIDSGYNVTYAGQKTYNGVALISKTSASDIITDIPRWTDPQRRMLGATIQGVRILNVYVPNGQSIDSEKYHYKLTWLEKFTDYLRQQLLLYPKLVVLGDFNIAPHDADVHDPILWEGHVLVSEPERQALQKLLHLGLQDTFRLFDQAPKSFSWWDYRAGAFRRNHGLRIDHILASNALAARCHHCEIDVQPRKQEQPSDHAPVIASFADET